MLNKLRYTLYRFMSGRYGNDALGYTLLGISIVLPLLGGFFNDQLTLFRLLSYIPLTWAIFRVFSRNIYKRRQENAQFLALINPFKKNIKVIRLNMTDKNHHHYLCPKCSQIVRVPKGRGRIEITCPQCSTTFTKKS